MTAGSWPNSSDNHSILPISKVEPRLVWPISLSSEARGWVSYCAAGAQPTFRRWEPGLAGKMGGWSETWSWNLGPKFLHLEMYRSLLSFRGFFGPTLDLMATPSTQHQLQVGSHQNFCLQWRATQKEEFRWSRDPRAPNRQAPFGVGSAPSPAESAPEPVTPDQVYHVFAREPGRRRCGLFHHGTGNQLKKHENNW